MTMHLSRRQFLKTPAVGAMAAALLTPDERLAAQLAGDRPKQADGVTVLNPQNRVPVGLIIDDSTCLVNLNRFAMPQFDAAFGGQNESFRRNWREWPAEIPDAFVRKFGEWSAEHGVKGKYSVIPYPACVGRIDRELPGWTQRELADSIELVRTLMTPNWDIHPEMVTHTRVIDVKTGHPYPDHSLRYMENWDWTNGRSTDELAAYMSYALGILKNVGLPCQGITTPGGFGIRVLPEIAQATLESVRDVFGAETPHYFRHAYDEGDESVAPRVEYAADLDGPHPRCVVSIIGCTSDWTGGWDNVPPAGADRFITADLKSGRMVDVIGRGEPAVMVCHWTGIYWNGQELGLKIFQEVVRRLHARFDNLIWMKLSELARYWAARELTSTTWMGEALSLRAPFACPNFTVRFRSPNQRAPRLRVDDSVTALREASSALKLEANTWRREGEYVTACFALPRGSSRLETAP